TQIGFNSQQLFEEIRESMLIQQVQAGIQQSAFALPAEIEYLIKLDKQKRDIATATLKIDDFKNAIMVSDEEIEQYYEQNKADYRTEEQVKLNYVEIGVDNMSIAEPTEEEVQQHFADMLQKEKAKE